VLQRKQVHITITRLTKMVKCFQLDAVKVCNYNTAEKYNIAEIKMYKKTLTTVGIDCIQTHTHTRIQRHIT